MADNIVVSDANAVDRTLRATDLGGGILAPHHVVESSALPANASTASLQTAGNGSLTSIDGKVATQTTLAALNGKVTAVDTGSVTIAASALPTDAATDTLQTAGNGSLTSIDGKVATEATLATIDTDTGNIATNTGNIETFTGILAGTVAGSEMQVDVVSVASPTTGVQFLITVSATATVAATNPLNSGVTLKADVANTTSVFVGFSGSVTTGNGHPLAAGDTLFLELSNTNLLYTIGTASDKLWVIGS